MNDNYTLTPGYIPPLPPHREKAMRRRLKWPYSKIHKRRIYPRIYTEFFVKKEDFINPQEFERFLRDKNKPGEIFYLKKGIL